MSSPPLVSCIMPTADRRAFVPQAMAYFQRQDYTTTELIVVDDGDDAIGDLIPADERIRHIRLSTKMTVGAKRNLACEAAHGEIIAHWNDADWHAPHRLRYQVEALLHSGADVCGITTLLFYDINTGRAWRYVYPADQRFWLSGSTLCYRKAFWARHSFTNVNVGEDVRFILSGRPEHMVVLPESTFHVGIIHGHNVAPKHTEGPYWHPYAVEEIRRLLGQDWRFYRLEGTETTDGTPFVSPALAAHAHERSIGMITVAREADMALPEYGALNHGQALPWMRRWEIPFALFQARLTNTMAVLDCTINPVGFQERLTRLYPHVLYRYWNPTPNGQFALPFGVPDAAFDRVICINTLEHLLISQREALIAAMARKLKPGGWLILTSDYYFDAFWSQPAFPQAGVMRADRSEIFNGWNKVTPQEWLEVCRRYDLHPIAETVEEPWEDDAGLYRQRPPYPHACIAGVFCKAPRAGPTSGQKDRPRAASLEYARCHHGLGAGPTSERHGCYGDWGKSHSYAFVITAQPTDWQMPCGCLSRISTYPTDSF